MAGMKEITVLNTINSKGNVKIKIYLKHAENSKLIIRIRNETDSKVIFRSDICDITEFQFMNFPIEGAFQFKTFDGKIVLIKGERPNGWWFPSSESSNLQRTEFFPRKSKIKWGVNQYFDKYSKLYDLMPHEEKIIYINYQNALNLSLASLNSNEKISSCRTMLSIRTATRTGTRRYLIYSDWFNVSSTFSK